MERDALAGTDEKDALGLKGRSLNQRKKGRGLRRREKKGLGKAKQRQNRSHAAVMHMVRLLWHQHDW